MKRNKSSYLFYKFDSSIDNLFLAY